MSPSPFAGFQARSGRVSTGMRTSAAGFSSQQLRNPFNLARDLSYLRLGHSLLRPGELAQGLLLFAQLVLPLGQKLRTACLHL